MELLNCVLSPALHPELQTHSQWSTQHSFFKSNRLPKLNTAKGDSLSFPSHAPKATSPPEPPSLTRCLGQPRRTGVAPDSSPSHTSLTSKSRQPLPPGAPEQSRCSHATFYSAWLSSSAPRTNKPKGNQMSSFLCSARQMACPHVRAAQMPSSGGQCGESA